MQLEAREPIVEAETRPLISAAISYSIYWRERTRLDVWSYAVNRLREVERIISVLEDYSSLLGTRPLEPIVVMVKTLVDASRNGDYSRMFAVLNSVSPALEYPHSRALASHWIITSARVLVAAAVIIPILLLLLESDSVTHALMYIVALGFALSSLLAFKSPLYTNLLMLSSIAVSATVFYTYSTVALLTASFSLVSALALHEVGGVLLEWIMQPLRLASSRQ